MCPSKGLPLLGLRFAAHEQCRDPWTRLPIIARLRPCGHRWSCLHNRPRPCTSELAFLFRLPHHDSDAPPPPPPEACAWGSEGGREEETEGVRGDGGWSKAGDARGVARPKFSMYRPSNMYARPVQWCLAHFEVFFWFSSVTSWIQRCTAVETFIICENHSFSVRGVKNSQKNEKTQKIRTIFASCPFAKSQTKYLDIKFCMSRCAANSQVGFWLECGPCSDARPAIQPFAPDQLLASA